MKSIRNKRTVSVKREIGVANVTRIAKTYSLVTIMKAYRCVKE